MGAVRREVVREGWCRVRDWTSERRIAFLGRAARMVEGKARAKSARKMEGVVALRRIVLDRGPRGCNEICGMCDGMLSFQLVLTSASNIQSRSQCCCRDGK
jgi:hypothetical protein